MKFILLVIVAILIALFAVQNSTMVTLSFFNYQFQSSLVVLVLISFALGIVCGIAYMLPSFFKKNLQISGLMKEVSKKSTEQNNISQPNKNN